MNWREETEREIRGWRHKKWQGDWRQRISNTAHKTDEQRRIQKREKVTNGAIKRKKSTTVRRPLIGSALCHTKSSEIPLAQNVWSDCGLPESLCHLSLLNRPNRPVSEQHHKALWSITHSPALRLCMWRDYNRKDGFSVHIAQDTLETIDIKFLYPTAIQQEKE